MALRTLQIYEVDHVSVCSLSNRRIIDANDGMLLVRRDGHLLIERDRSAQPYGTDDPVTSCPSIPLLARVLG
jgi:hypothetical protein